MTHITLTKTETTLLTEAAGRGGLLILPTSLKAVTAQRLVGRLLRDQLITAREQDGTAEHHLAVAAYEALGLSPPRQPGAKQAMVLDLLGRGKGATVDELMAATGWLPHTTRAALTGLRRRGYEILRGKDESGRTMYRIEVETPKPVARAARRRRPEVSAAAAA